MEQIEIDFQKISSNMRPASRPVSTPSGNGRTWDQYFLYNPEILVKIIEKFRFYHNWTGTRKTKRTPTMKLGLAKDRIYERDLFGE